VNKNTFEKNLTHKELLSKLMGFLHSTKGMGIVLLSFGITLLGKICTAVFPLFFKKALDVLKIFPDHYQSAILLLLGYGIFRVLAFGLSDLRDIIFTPLEQRIIRHIGREVFGHLHNLPLAFHLDRKTGGMANAIERGTKAIESFFRFFIFNIIPSAFEILLVCCLLWVWYPIFYGTAFFLTIFFYGLFTIWVSAWRLKQISLVNTIVQESRTYSLDSLLNYATVKYFNNENTEVQRYDTLLGQYEKLTVKVRSSLGLLNLGQTVIMSLGITAIMIKVILDSMNGSMTLNDAVLMNMYLSQFYIPLHILGTAYREVTQSLLDMKELFSILSIPGESKDFPGACPLNFKGGEIVFKEIDFGYIPDRPVMKNFSLRVPAGSRLALVGVSGAGKSSLLSLLFRFLEPQKGSILIDEQDIRCVTRQSLRQVMGVVPQDIVLFNGTLASNIGYGNPQASFEEIRQAARKACLDNFIESLPEKYETVVGERGLKLSGGEKQRVAIARMLLKKPKIFIFDEATSSLDTQTERHIQKNILEISQGHTTILVAHRLSTIVNADKIAVIKDGRIWEKGSHEELLKHGGVYAELWKQQKDQEFLNN
jgi:ATP-binding cassette, subfamily B, heavy metal transporter